MKSTYGHDILTYLQAHQQEMTELLTQLIELESPTDSKPHMDRFSTFLVGELLKSSARVETFFEPVAGNHLRAHWGDGEGGCLILCHMDTVWDVGTVANRPVRISDGRIYGPGAEDMKGGIVVALWAMKALIDLKIAIKKPVTILFTSDEETGSITSKPVIEREIFQKDVVYVMEPAQPPLGSYKTARKGAADYVIKVKGLAAHAGADHEKGINALEELAHQILDVQGFTDYAKGTTFNVGVMSGGTRPNVVPAYAQAEIDVRFMYLSEVAVVDEKMRNLKTHLAGVKIEILGSVDRPPMERTPEIVAQFIKAKELAKDMGIELTEATAGGASDGNLTSAMGIPTLDGMGVVGDGGHSIDEYAVIASLPERAAILAALLSSS